MSSFTVKLIDSINQLINNKTNGNDIVQVEINTQLQEYDLKHLSYHEFIKNLPIQNNFNKSFIDNYYNNCNYLSINSKRTIAYRKLDSGTSNNQSGVVFINGFMSNMSGRKIQRLAEYCYNQNRSFVSFDYSGHGLSANISSNPKFDECCLSTWIEDTEAIIANLTTGPQLLVCSSMGAWITLILCKLNDIICSNVIGIVLLAPGVDFIETRLLPSLSSKDIDSLKTDGKIIIPSIYDSNGYTITDLLVQDAKQYRLSSYLKDKVIPLEIIHGTSDHAVHWSESIKLIHNLDNLFTNRLTLVIGGDHRLSNDFELHVIESVVNRILNIK